MKKKKVRITLLIVTLLLLISVGFTITDKILYEKGKNAIFVRDMGGCDVEIYQGIYYRIMYYHPLFSAEDYQGITSDWFWFWE